MNGATGFDGCDAYDAELMESAMLGRLGPELEAHLDACHECSVALAGYQLTVQTIRRVDTLPAPILDRPRTPGRAWVPRLLVAAAAIAAAVLVLVLDTQVVAPTTGTEDTPTTLVASNSGATNSDSEFWTGSDLLKTVPVHGTNPIVETPGQVSDLPRTKIECIEVGGGCVCCMGCDLQMLVGDDQTEHFIPASLQGLEIGIHVGVGTRLFPHGGFILAPDSALL